jgi:hypothetical protein
MIKCQQDTTLVGNLIYYWHDHHYALFLILTIVLDCFYEVMIDASIFIVVF